MPTTKLLPVRSTEQLTRQLLGYGGLSLHPGQFRTTMSVAASTGYFFGMGVSAGAVVTNVILFPSTIPVGTNPTACSLGVLDSTGKCVATTADVGTSFKSAVVQQPFSVALTSTYTSPSDQFLFFGWWMQGSYVTTQPAFYVGAGANGIQALGSNPMPLGTVASVAGALTVNTTYTLVVTNAQGIAVGWN